MAYRAERVPLPAAEADVLRLWKDNLSFHFDPSLKLNWFYRDNPYGPADVFLLLDERGGTAQVVGCSGLGRRRICHHDALVSASLPADLAVDRKHRLLAPALLLQRAVREHARRTTQICYAFPNPPAMPVLVRAGYEKLGRFRRYVRVLDFAQPVASRAGGRLVSGPLAGAAGAAAHVANAARLLLRARGRSLRWLTDVDPGFECLWRARRAEVAFVGERTSEFLRWRFLNRPGVRSRLAAVYDNRSGRPTAYAFLTVKEEGAAFLADFAFSTPRDLGTLLDFVARELRAEGVGRIETHFLGPRHLRRLLMMHEFIPHGTGKWVVVSIGQGIVEGEVLEPENWFLTDADRDN